METATIEQIPLEKIDWPAQERKHFDPVKLAALSETIRIHGVEQAIGVTTNGDRFTGLWGQRRWLASKAAGLATIPAVVREVPRSETEQIELRLIENVARESLNPVELAEGLARLMEAGAITAAAAAGRVGMNASHVSKTLRLLSLPEFIREQVRSGVIPASSGYALAQVHDAAEQAELAQRIVNGQATRDAVSGAARRKGKTDAASPTSGSTRVSAALGNGRTIAISGAGLSSLEVMIAWLEQLLGKARKARTQGIEIKTFITMLRDQAKQDAEGQTV